MDRKRKEEEILRILALPLRRLFQEGKIPFSRLQEIRLRTGQPLLVVYDGREFFVDGHGRLLQDQSKAYLTGESDIRESMEYISNFSLYAFEEELRQGFLTIRGGHRIGVAGKLIVEDNKVKNIRHISCLNIRLAHEIPGCADKILPYLLEEGEFVHTLLISPPRCGKTTLLRDLVRQLSDGGERRAGVTVGVVDERSEIGACYMGVPQNALGCRTDILDGCPKVEGMMMLVRSMAPQVIAVDEVGSREDVEAMEYVMHSGVKLIATAHGSSLADIRRKPVLCRMVKEQQFRRYIILQKKQPGHLQAVLDERERFLFRAGQGREWGTG